MQTGVFVRILRTLYTSASGRSDQRRLTDMTTLLGSDFDAARHAPAPDGDERSIREAVRITTLFLAVVLFLLWAGLSDASVITDSSVRAAGPGVPSSSPTLR
jgi:hypothetical protein